MIHTILCRINEGERPPYRRILNAIERAIEDGALNVGDRMPTHRELCRALNVAVATVTRAYSEAERRGLLHSQVGSGTFVAQREKFRSPKTEAPSADYIDLAMYRMDVKSTPAATTLFANILKDLLQPAMLNLYQPPFGDVDQRTAGASWLKHCGSDVAPQNVIPSNGGQHGMLIAVAASTRIGEMILTEQLTDPALKAVALLLGRPLRGVECDDEGMLPSDLERAVAESGAHTVFLTPTFHNPTTSTMSEQRRQDIAKVARQLNLTVIESLMYVGLMKDPPKALASYIPERTIVVGSLWQVLGTSAKIGYVAGFSDIVDKLATAVSLSTGRVAAIPFQFGVKCILDGLIEPMVTAQRQELQIRTALCRRLHGQAVSAPGNCVHAWLALPEPWRSDEFVEQLREEGVMAAATHSFVVGRGQSPHAIRLCIGTPTSADTLQLALSKVAKLMSDRHI